MKIRAAARTVVGALLLLVIIGEPAVGFVTGQYSPQGFIILLLLYVFVFLVLDAAIARYKLNATGLICITAALYAIFITGMIHGEIANFLKSEEVLITALIRIQASFYSVYAFALLNKLFPRPAKTVSLKKATALLMAYVLLLSISSDAIGFVKLSETAKAAPLLFIVFAVIAVVLAAKAKRHTQKLPATEQISAISLYLLLIALIPNMGAFMVLLFSTILATLYLFKTHRLNRISV